MSYVINIHIYMSYVINIHSLSNLSPLNPSTFRVPRLLVPHILEWSVFRHASLCKPWLQNPGKTAGWCPIVS